MILACDTEVIVESPLPELIPEPPNLEVIVVPVGPRGIQGPVGPAGPPASAFTFVQSFPASQWNVNHNLGRFEQPTVFVDPDTDTPVYPDFSYPDADNTLIIFPSPASGRAEF